MKTVMTPPIKITKVAQSKVSQVDLNNVSMGTHFSDHMFICDMKMANGTIQELNL